MSRPQSSGELIPYCSLCCGTGNGRNRQPTRALLPTNEQMLRACVNSDSAFSRIECIKLEIAEHGFTPSYKSERILSYRPTLLCYRLLPFYLLFSFFAMFIFHTSLASVCFLFLCRKPTSSHQAVDLGKHRKFVQINLWWSSAISEI